MLSWLFESVLLLTIIQLVTAVTEYPCTNHRIIYEASPDYGYDSGATGYIYRVRPAPSTTLPLTNPSPSI